MKTVWKQTSQEVIVEILNDRDWQVLKGTLAVLTHSLLPRVLQSLIKHPQPEQSEG